jgi:Signal transduction histidine kinase
LLMVSTSKTMAPGSMPMSANPCLKPDTLPRAEGTGFGLSIVKQVTEAHGWNICVTDGAEGGTRFEITGVEAYN